MKFQSELVSEKFRNLCKMMSRVDGEVKDGGLRRMAQGTRSDVKKPRLDGWTHENYYRKSVRENWWFPGIPFIIVKIIQFWYDVKLFCVCFLEMAFNSPNWWTTKSSRVPDTAGLDSGKMTKVETQSIRLSSVWGWEVGWGKSKKVKRWWKRIWEGRVSKPGLFSGLFL